MAVANVKIKELTKNKFRLTYWLHGKRIKRKTIYCNQREAELIATQHRSNLLAGKFDFINEANRQSISLGKLIDEFLTVKKGQVRETTHHRYKNYLKPFQDYFQKYFPEPSKDIGLIKALYITTLFTHLKEEVGWAPKTLKDTRNCISSLFIYAIEQEYLIKNPVKKTKPIALEDEKELKFFTEDQIKEILKTVDPFWKDHLEFIYLAGLRRGEMINLTWDRVRLDGKEPQMTIASDKYWKTKTGKKRVLPLTKKTVEIIEKFKGKNKTFVFTDQRGNKIHPDRPYRALKIALEELGLDGTVHTLRHSFAAKLVMSGESLYTVMKLLGHTDIETTQIYAHLSPGFLRGAMDKM
jgi:integrase